jgi:hypothetical protein
MQSTVTRSKAHRLYPTRLIQKPGLYKIKNKSFSNKFASMKGLIRSIILIIINLLAHFCVLFCSHWLHLCSICQTCSQRPCYCHVCTCNSNSNIHKNNIHLFKVVHTAFHSLASSDSAVITNNPQQNTLHVNDCYRTFNNKTVTKKHVQFLSLCFS